MTLKEKVANIISDSLYGLLSKKSLNYHVSLRNLIKSKPNNIDLIDYSLFSLYNKNYSEKNIYEKALAATEQYAQDSASKRMRHYTIFQLLNTVLDKNVPGQIVECGCFKGQSAYAIATILKNRNIGNKFFIFDSFEGLSDIKSEDENEIKNLAINEISTLKKQFAASLQLVKNNLKEFDFIEYYKGWIPERFHEIEDEQFMFVNIDVDLYHPIKDSLEFFYPRLSPGGIIFLDDYGFSQFPGAKRAVDEYLTKIDCKFFMYFPFGGAVIVK
jgi:predicted O-methyltransferase YrrM